MNIAQQVKSAATEANESIDFKALVEQAELRAVDTEQDFDAESTTYTFADGSCLVWCGEFVSVYGSKD